MKNKYKILIAVSAYNEEKNIESTLKSLVENNKGYDIVVIDNGSTDKTKIVATEIGIKVISHCVNSGSSMGTVMTYFLYAYREKYDILCQFDGDGQHLATELPKIIIPIQDGMADYVIGSRFINKVGFQSYPLRRMGINIFSYLDSKIIGHKVTDVTSGFRGYSRKVIEFFANYYKHEIHDTNQLLLLSHFAEAKICEIPIMMKERQNGESEYNFLNAFAFPFKGLINILGCLIQKNKIKNYIEQNGN